MLLLPFIYYLFLQYLLLHLCLPQSQIKHIHYPTNQNNLYTS